MQDAIPDHQRGAGRADGRVPGREPQELHLPLRPRRHDHLHVPEEPILLQGIFI